MPEIKNVKEIFNLLKFLKSEYSILFDKVFFLFDDYTLPFKNKARNLYLGFIQTIKCSIRYG